MLEKSNGPTVSDEVRQVGGDAGDSSAWSISANSRPSSAALAAEA